MTDFNNYNFLLINKKKLRYVVFVETEVIYNGTGRLNVNI